MMKRVISILLVVTLLITSLSTTVFATDSAGKPTACLQISEATGSIGDTVTVSVSLEHSNVCGGNFTINYDNSRLSVVSVNKTVIMSDRTTIENAAYSESSIRVTFSGTTAMTNAGEIYTISFNVIDGENTTSEISISDFMLYGENAEEINATTINGAVHILDSESSIISLESASAYNGTTVSVDVNIAGNFNICGGSFNVAYDTEKLELIDFTAGNAIAGNSPVINKNYAQNKVRLTFMGTSPIASNSPLGTLVFKVRNNASGVANVLLEDTRLYDGDSNSITHISTNGAIHILQSSEALVKLYTEDTTVKSGTSVEIPVYISKDSGVNGGSFNLKYDSSVFEVKSVAAGELLGNYSLVPNINYDNNTVRITFSGANPISDDGILCVINATVDENALGTYQFLFDNIKLYDTELNVVNTSFDNGEINIQSSLPAYGVIKAYNDIGEEVTSFAPGTFTFSVVINNTELDLMNPILYVAIYEDNTTDKLIDLKSAKCSSPIEKNAIGKICLPIVVMDNCEGKYIKAFLWDEDNRPLTDSITLHSTEDYISIDTSSFAGHITSENAYLLDSYISSLAGSISSNSPVSAVSYKVTDLKGNIIKSGTVSVTGDKQWTIANIGFVLGKNTLSLEAILDNDVVLEKRVDIYNNCKDNIINTGLNVDSDSDGLMDYEELVYGTNKTLSDTDSDGLNDYFEIQMSGTMANTSDSDGNGITDPDEDFDSDGLSNKIEYQNNGNPYLKDTDSDGLSDGEELQIGSKLNVVDTDGDGLTDKQDTSYGMSPIMADTDNDGISDADEFVSYQMDVNDFSDEEEVTFVMDVQAQANNITNVTVQKISDDDYLLNDSVPGFIDNAYEITGVEEAEKVTVTFKLPETITDVDEYSVYKISSTNQVFEKQESISNTNNSISVTITQSGKYILLNRKSFDEVWETEIKGESQTGEQSAPWDIVFVIDSSGSMYSNDEDNLRLDVAKRFVDKMRENDRAGVVDFDSWYTVYDFSLDKDTVKNNIDSIDSSGGTDILSGLEQGVQLFLNSNRESIKTILLLTDGEDYSDIDDYAEVIATANANGITVYTVGLGYGIDASVLSDIAAQTSGQYYFAEYADDLYGQFDDIKENVDVVTDTDGDGLSDYHEQHIRLTNGCVITTDVNNPDSDGDGVKDSEEIVPIRNSDGTIYAYYFVSNPLKKDTDADGLSDNQEINVLGTDPLKPEMLKTQLNSLLNPDLYASGTFEKEFSQNAGMQISAFLGNNFFGSNHNKVQIYKDALIELLSDMYDEQSEKSEIYEFYKQIKKYRKHISTYNKVITQDTKEAIETLEKSMTEFDLDGLAKSFNNVSRAEWEAKYKEWTNLCMNTEELKNFTIELDGIKTKLDTFKKATGAIDLVVNIVKVNGKKDAIEANILILDEIIRSSSDWQLVTAAAEVKAEAENMLNTIMLELSDTVINFGMGAASDLATTTILTAIVGKAGSFWVNVAANIASSVTGVSNVSKKAIQTVMLADVCNLLSSRLNKTLSLSHSVSINNDVLEFYEIKSNAIEGFLSLIETRKHAEKTYLEMRTLNGFMSLLLNWALEYDEAKVFCEESIERLNDMGPKFLQIRDNDIYAIDDNSTAANYGVMCFASARTISVPEISATLNGSNISTSVETESDLSSIVVMKTDLYKRIFDIPSAELMQNVCWINETASKNGQINIEFNSHITNGLSLYESSKNGRANNVYLLKFNEDKSVVGFVIHAQPTRTEYTVGDAFAIDGLKLECTYNDSTTAIVDCNDTTEGLSISGFDSSSSGEKIITVNYFGFNQTFIITVISEEVIIDPTKPIIEVESKIGVAGSKVAVNIALRNNPGIVSATMRVKFDTSVMTLVEVKDLGNLGTKVHRPELVSPYTLAWANDTISDNITYNGNIVTLIFEISENANLSTYPIEISYNYDNYDIYNVNAEKVNFQTVSGNVTVTNVLIGDVNSDNQVNNLDRMILTRYLADWSDYSEEVINMLAADVNADGQVNNLDRMILTRHLADWSGYEELPIN